MKKLLILASCGVLTVYAIFEPPAGGDIRPIDEGPAAQERLWTAIKNNNVTEVENCFAQGPQLPIITDPNTGETLLHAAVKAKPFLGFIGNTFDLVKTVLGYNPPAVMVQDHEGNTPVHLAVMGGNPDIVAILIINTLGTSTDEGEEACFMKNKNWQTPLDIAEEMRNRSIFFTSRMKTIVKLITDAQDKERNEHRRLEEEVKKILDTEPITDETISVLESFVTKDPMKCTRCNGRESILHMVLEKYFMLEWLQGTERKSSAESSKKLLDYACQLMQKFPDMLILQNHYGDTVLHRAIKHHSAAVVEEILKYPQGRFSLILKHAGRNAPTTYQIQTMLDDQERQSTDDATIQKINASLKKAYEQIRKEQQAR